MLFAKSINAIIHSETRLPVEYRSLHLRILQQSGTFKVNIGKEAYEWVKSENCSAY